MWIISAGQHSHGLVPSGFDDYPLHELLSADQPYHTNAHTNTGVTGSPLVLQRPRTAERWPHQHGTTEGVTLQWQGANSDTVSPGVCSSYQQLLHCQFDRDYTTVRQPAVCGSTPPLTQLNKSFFITVIICCRIWDVTFSGLLRQSSLPKTVCTTRKKDTFFVDEVISWILSK